MLTQSMPLSESGLNYTYLCSFCDSNDPGENASEHTDTLKIEEEDPDGEV